MIDAIHAELRIYLGGWSSTYLWISVGSSGRVFGEHWNIPTGRPMEVELATHFCHPHPRTHHTHFHWAQCYPSSTASSSLYPKPSLSCCLCIRKVSIFCALPLNEIYIFDIIGILMWVLEFSPGGRNITRFSQSNLSFDKLLFVPVTFSLSLPGPSDSHTGVRDVWSLEINMKSLPNVLIAPLQQSS